MYVLAVPWAHEEGAEARRRVEVKAFPFLLLVERLCDFQSQDQRAQDASGSRRCGHSIIILGGDIAAEENGERESKGEGSEEVQHVADPLLRSSGTCVRGSVQDGHCHPIPGRVLEDGGEARRRAEVEAVPFLLLVERLRDFQSQEQRIQHATGHAGKFAIR
jgi:hypothetical protein